jgi:hypothetical protein
MCLLACQPKKETLPSTKTYDSFDFLVGNWVRTNDEEGNKTYETWIKENDSTYRSHGYTIHGLDTIWQEYAVLAPLDTAWYFTVVVSNDTHNVPFLLTAYDAYSFTCENAYIDFPKVIRYRKNGNGLHAEIEGNGRIIPFVFEPLH